MSFSFNTFPNLLKQFGLIASIVFLGTIFDWLIFKVFGLDSRPDYFQGRVIFGTIWAFAVFLVFRDHVKTAKMIAYIVSFNLALLTQLRYLIEGDHWHILLPFLIFRFLYFLLPAIVIFSLFKNVFGLIEKKIRPSAPPHKKPA